MPNWCNNTLTLRHENPAMIQRARDAFVRGELLSEFFPCPADLSREGASSYGGTDKEANDRIREENLARHGYSNWFDWCVANWGTKWDIGGDACEAMTTEHEFTAGFDSAWAPPTTAYEKFLELGFEVRAMYYEPGMCFAGVWEDGFDDYYEYSDMNSDEVAESLPKELDEAFGISESMAEWEAENEEENLDIDLDGGVSAVNEQEKEDE